MTKYDELNEQLANLLTEDASKEQIEKIAVIKNTVDKLAEESAKQEAEYKDLLKDYSSVIKASAFNTDKTKADEGTKEVNLDNFFNDWANKNNLSIKKEN